MAEYTSISTRRSRVSFGIDSRSFFASDLSLLLGTSSRIIILYERRRASATVCGSCQGPAPPFKERTNSGGFKRKIKARKPSLALPVCRDFAMYHKGHTRDNNCFLIVDL
eukprot:1391542-Amorphochlora_amoeboformis.AAC.2